jgi:hypothetical protein
VSRRITTPVGSAANADDEAFTVAVQPLTAMVALIVAPCVLGYSDHTLPTVFSIVVGAGGLGATLLTRFDSDLPVAMPATRSAGARLTAAMGWDTPAQRRKPMWNVSPR